MPDRPALVTGFRFTKATMAELGADFDFVGHLEPQDPAQVTPEIAAAAQGLITLGSLHATDALMAAMPRLSIICCLGTGYERIDLDAARRRGIRVTHGADANAPDVAEMAVGLLLASSRRIASADRMIRRGDWVKRLPNRMGPVAGLTGARVGILGLGAIGMAFARRIVGFDVEIGYCNRKPRGDVAYPYFGSAVALAEWADHLVVCLRSDASNRHIVNADVLRALGSRGHVVNISRGWAVDEAALGQALRDGVIEGAALDVFDEEPYTGTDLKDLDNLVMTPHLAGGTQHAQRRMTALLKANLDAHFAGKPLPSPVPELRDLPASP